MNLPQDHPVLPEFRFGKQRLDQYLKIHSERVPNKICINYYGTEITWEKMNEYVDRMASYLAKNGVVKGDPVCIFMQSCPQFMIAFYAIQRIGGIVVPLSPMFKEWELEYETNEVKAKFIIANSYLYPIVKNVIESTSLETVILSSLNDFLPDNPEITLNFNPEEPESFDQSVSMMEILEKEEINVPEVTVDIEDIGLIMFTSGSAGLPKGVMLAYYSALYKAVSSSTCYHTTEYTKYLSSQPIYHIAGMVFMNGHIYLGSTMYLITKIEAETIMKVIDKYKCDYWYGSAVMNKEIIEHPNLPLYNLSSMRQTVTTSFGIQLTEEMATKWKIITNGGSLVEWAYGLTESHTMDTGTPVGFPKYGTCGTEVFEDSHVRILDEEGNEVPAGEIGEITLKHPALLKGYLNDPEATKNALRDGWLFTGDTGKKDEDGYVSFLGRKKEMIKTSGFSVFPEEIEMYLCRHEAVAKSIVIGKPDSTRGEVIKAFVVIKPEFKDTVTVESLLEWSKDKMAAYKRPREIEFRDDLPATGTGKLLRRILREEEAKK